MSLSVNLFKGAYLGTACGLLWGATKKETSLLNSLKYGLISGIAVTAFASLLDKVTEVNVNKKKVDHLIKNMCFDVMYGSFFDSMFKAVVAPVRGKIPIKTGMLGIFSGCTIILCGNWITSRIKIKTIPIKEPSFTPIDLTSEYLHEIGLGGLDKHINNLKKLILTRTRCHTDDLAKRNIKPVKGLLLYGPTGTGKTTLAKHLGTLLGCRKENIILKAAPELYNQFIGGSEENVRNLFDPAKRDQEEYGEGSPLHLVIIDEIDALIKKRELILNTNVNVCEQFLTCFDGLEPIENLVVIGITNRYQDLDPAAIRPGRFDMHLEVGLPNASERKEIIHYYLTKISDNLDDSVDIAKLTYETESFSGAEIENMINTANSSAWMRGMSHTEDVNSGKVTMSDLLEALKSIRASKNNDVIPEGIYS